ASRHEARGGVRPCDLQRGPQPASAAQPRAAGQGSGPRPDRDHPPDLRPARAHSRRTAAGGGGSTSSPAAASDRRLRVRPAGVRAEQKLFATLDPTTRKLELPAGRELLLTDTVGFIQKLPTDLVAAFRATLEEVTEADLIIQVLDVSSPAVDEQAETVEQVLADLGAADKPRVVALNKVDLLAPAARRRAISAASGRYPGASAVSATNRSGLPQLLEAIDRASRGD